MPSTAPYQLMIIDTQSSNDARLRSAVEDAVQEFSDESLVRFFRPAERSQVDPQLPLAGVVFGGGSFGTADNAAIDALLERGAAIFPVVPDTKTYAANVPASLHPTNGLSIADAGVGLERLAGLVLESFKLLRSTRRLFISYLRDESRNATLQLYHELDERNFDVFVDTHKVGKGAEFQEVLWHRMTDSDLVVFMHTPGVMGSKWVREEVEHANTMGMTVLEVIWPGIDRQNNPLFHLFEPLYLAEDDFESHATAEGGRSLKKDALKRIVDETEKLRARSVAARQTNLIKTLCDTADVVGLRREVRNPRCVDLLATKRGRVRVYVDAGVPQSLAFQAAHEDSDVNPAERRLLYDSQYVMGSWQRHLDWLDGHVPAKRVLRTDLYDWMVSLK